MQIKDFKKGQTAYILNLHKGRNTEPTIHETTVKSVGRTYVTTERGTRYRSSDDAYSLDEAPDRNGYQRHTNLYPTRDAADAIIEREALRIWFMRAGSHAHEYSLEQLREVKRILEG